MSLIDDMDARTRQAAQRSKPIDYARMNALWPKQKAALTRAVNKVKAAQAGVDNRFSGEPSSPALTKAREELAAVCKKAVKEWDEVGAWPDDWRRFERALEDALPWGTAVDLRYL